MIRCPVYRTVPMFVAFTLIPLSAFGAGHTVNFDALPPGTLPYSFTSEAVDITVGPYTDTIGDACAPTDLGFPSLVDHPFPGCASGSAPNQFAGRNVLVEFDMADYEAQVGGPVKRVNVKYHRIFGNVQISFNGQCFTRTEFSALPNGVYGGVKYKDSGCRIRLRRKPNYITQFSIGGFAFVIDDVRVNG